MKIRLAFTLFASFLAVSSCTPANPQLEAQANAIIAAMGGTIEYKGTTTKSCVYDGVGHWGGTVGFTVCVSGGLSTADSGRGTVALHESSHVWLHRMAEWYDRHGIAFPDYGILRDEEIASDCFAHAHGGNPAYSNYAGYQKCSTEQIDFVKGWMAYFPTNNSSNWVGN